MNIGLKIKNAREDKDILQKQMAAMIPMNQSNYSKIERDLQEPNLSQLKRIAEILDLDLNELLEIGVTPETSPELYFAKEVKAAYEKYFLK